MKKSVKHIAGLLALAAFVVVLILGMIPSTRRRTPKGLCVLPGASARKVTCDEPDAFEVYDKFILFGLVRIGTQHKPCSLKSCDDNGDDDDEGDCVVETWKRYTPRGKCSLPSSFGPVDVSFNHPDAFVIYIGYDQHGNCLPKNMLRRVPCDL